MEQRKSLIISGRSRPVVGYFMSSTGLTQHVHIYIIQQILLSGQILKTFCQR